MDDIICEKDQESSQALESAKFKYSKEEFEESMLRQIKENEIMDKLSKSARNNAIVSDSDQRV